MSIDLKRQLVAQLVESSRLLRNYIDHRAKTRGTTRAQWIVLFRLREQEGLSQVDLADVGMISPTSLTVSNSSKLGTTRPTAPAAAPRIHRGDGRCPSASIRKREGAASNERRAPFPGRCRSACECGISWSGLPVRPLQGRRCGRGGRR